MVENPNLSPRARFASLPILTAFCRQPSNVLPITAGPTEIVEQLRNFHLCQVRAGLAADRCTDIRRLAETTIGQGLGGNYAIAFGQVIGPRLYRVNVSIMLHLLRSPVGAVLAQYFKRAYGTPDMMTPLLNLVTRRYDPQDKGTDAIAIPFHQDGNLLPRKTKILNCWTMLSPDECGETSPGLEFILGVRKLIPMAKVGKSEHYGFLETDHAKLDRLISSRESFRPSIKLGDVMIFDEIALHRTWLSPSQTQARISAELRFIGMSKNARAYYSKDETARFEVIDNVLRGPSIVRQIEDGSLHCYERGEWPLNPDAA